MSKSLTVKLSETSWAVVRPGKSITLVSIAKDATALGTPMLKEQTFQIGESAEYDSYNLSYFGPIKSITKKNVIVQHKHSERRMLADRLGRSSKTVRAGRLPH